MIRWYAFAFLVGFAIAAAVDAAYLREPTRVSSMLCDREGCK